MSGQTACERTLDIHIISTYILFQLCSLSHSRLCAHFSYRRQNEMQKRSFVRADDLRIVFAIAYFFHPTNFVSIVVVDVVAVAVV